MKYLLFICLFVCAVFVGHWTMSPPWQQEESVALSSLDDGKARDIQRAGQFIHTAYHVLSGMQPTIELSCLKEAVGSYTADQANAAAIVNKLINYWVNSKSKVFGEVTQSQAQSCEKTCSCLLMLAYVRIQQQSVSRSSNPDLLRDNSDLVSKTKAKLNGIGAEETKVCAQAFAKDFCSEDTFLKDLADAVRSGDKKVSAQSVDESTDVSPCVSVEKGVIPKSECSLRSCVAVDPSSHKQFMGWQGSYAEGYGPCIPLPDSKVTNENDCAFNGAKIKSRGNAVEAFSSQDCKDAKKQFRQCLDGTLLGSYQYSSCR